MRKKHFVLNKKKLIPETLEKIDHLLDVVHNLMVFDHFHISHSVSKLNK